MKKRRNSNPPRGDYMLTNDGGWFGRAVGLLLSAAIVIGLAGWAWKWIASLF